MQLVAGRASELVVGCGQRMSAEHCMEPCPKVSRVALAFAGIIIGVQQEMLRRVTRNATRRSMRITDK